MTDSRSWWASLIDRPGLLGRVRRQWPWVVIVGIVGIGLILIAFGLWRLGAVVIGVAMLVAGVFRATIKNPGIMVIRPQRWVDLCFYFGLGAAILILAIIRSPPPV